MYYFTLKRMAKKVSKIYIKTIRGSEAISFESDGAYKILLSQPNAGDQMSFNLNGIGSLTGRDCHTQDFELYSGDPNIPLKFSGNLVNINAGAPNSSLLGITFFKLENE